MKTRKILNQSLILAAIFLIAVACKDDHDKSPEASTSSLNVMMTDAPAVFNQVNVEVIRVEAQIGDSVSGGWYVLSTDSGIYDLLELQEDTVLIANHSSLPSGRLNQIRLYLGENNTVMADSVIHDLKVPSGQQSGYKILVHEELGPNQSYELTIDFDAHESVVVTGNNKFILKPVIKAVDFVQQN